MAEVDVIIKARIDLDEVGVETVEELNEILDDADAISVEIETSVDSARTFTLLKASVEEVL